MGNIFTPHDPLLLMVCKLHYIWTRAMYIQTCTKKCRAMTDVKYSSLWHPMTNVNSANFSAKQHCPHRVHWLCSRQYIVQNNAKRTLVWKETEELRATTWKMFCTDFLSHCVKCTLRPSSSAALDKQSHNEAHGTVSHCYLNQVAIARVIIANNVVLPRSEVWRAEKAPSAYYLTALSNTQQNATHWMLRSTAENLFHFPPCSKAKVIGEDKYFRFKELVGCQHP